jgi:hypothetical protein
MARFGLFNIGDARPSQSYDGDYMVHNGEHVTIMRHAKEQDKTTDDKAAAAIRLSPSQSVKEVQ